MHTGHWHIYSPQEMAGNLSECCARQCCSLTLVLCGCCQKQVQMHEPILTTTDAAKLKAEFESSYAELSKVGVPLSLVRALPGPPSSIPIRFFEPMPA